MGDELATGQPNVASVANVTDCNILTANAQTNDSMQTIKTFLAGAAKAVVSKFMLWVIVAIGLFSFVTGQANAALPDPTATVTAATTLFTAIGVLALAILLWNVGSRLVRKYIKSIIAVGGLSFAAMSARADLPDPTETVTAATTLMEAIGVLALAILLWNVGSRLVRKYVK